MTCSTRRCPADAGLFENKEQEGERLYNEGRYAEAADLYKEAIDVQIRVNAEFNSLGCSGTSAVLGSAGSTQIYRDFPGAPHAFTVFGTSRYQERADKRSWERFKGFLADTLR